MTNLPTTAIMSLLLLFRILFTICVASYTPDDNFLVNCGSSQNSSSMDGRKWTGDTDSRSFSLIELSDGSKSLVRDNSPINTVPYNMARFSRSNFSYLFHVKTDGQKFIRLYFYPASYGHNFIRSDSVSVGPHTLLKDFDASVTADYTDQITISREYSVNIVHPREGLETFTPSSSHPNAYAFIDGIEVISMPIFLYYTNPNTLLGMFLQGGAQQYAVKNDRALETVYRINVGGRTIPPEEDTGMFRYWDDNNANLKSGERQYSVSSGFGLFKANLQR